MAKEYDEELLLVAMVGDLSLASPLFEKFEAAFWDWYGEPSFEDTHCSSNFPEVDSAEWFKSRILEINASVEDYAEIQPGDLESEIRSSHLSNL